jgi:hypothetical protein
MTNEQLCWPTERINEDAVSDWIATHCGHRVGSPVILQSKAWGVTARFDEVVLKASFTPLFPQVVNIHAVLDRAAPENVTRLIAHTTVEGQLWTLFEYIPGQTVEEAGTAEALISMAQSLATVQGGVAREDLTHLPTMDPFSIPSLLLDDSDDQPAELVEWLYDAQFALQADAKVLAALPTSLDHPDMNSSNAILYDNRRVVLLDWEEATAGSPLFSIDRLLADARRHSAVERVVNAYLEALPWGGLNELSSALRLVPLKLAIEARAFARGLGWPHPHTRYTTRMLEEARRRYSLKDGSNAMLDYLGQI